MRIALLVSAITLKPTLTHPTDFGKVKEDKDTADLGTQCSWGILLATQLSLTVRLCLAAARLKATSKKPNEKYPMPMTEAQRVGYVTQSVVHPPPCMAQPLSCSADGSLRMQRKACRQTCTAACSKDAGGGFKCIVLLILC